MCSGDKKRATAKLQNHREIKNCVIRVVDGVLVKFWLSLFSIYTYIAVQH